MLMAQIARGLETRNNNQDLQSRGAEAPMPSCSMTAGCLTGIDADPATRACMPRMQGPTASPIIPAGVENPPLAEGQSSLADAACTGAPAREVFSDLFGPFRANSVMQLDGDSDSRDMWHIGSPDEPLLQDFYRSRNDDTDEVYIDDPPSMGGLASSTDAACTGAPAGEAFSDMFGYFRAVDKSESVNNCRGTPIPPRETLELGESYLGSPSTCNHEMRSPGCNCAPGSDEAGVPKPLLTNRVPKLPREVERSSVREDSVEACPRDRCLDAARDEDSDECGEVFGYAVLRLGRTRNR